MQFCRHEKRSRDSRDGIAPGCPNRERTDKMKKETLLHSKKIQKMITQYKHDMQLVDQLTADAAPRLEEHTSELQSR